MKHTNNYNLKKPEGTDPVKISDLNDNMDIVDDVLKANADNIATKETPAGAQSKANAAENAAKAYTDIHEQKVAPHSGHETPAGAQAKVDALAGEGNTKTVKELDDELASHKEDYMQFKNDSTLESAKIEKELNDYKATLAGMNPNQEPKQKVNGYGIIPLPKNAANGQVSVGVKGETRTNLVKSSNMDKDTNGDGVVDDFNVWKPENVTSIISFDTKKKAQKIEITGGTGTTHTEINQSILGFNTGDIISGQYNIELTGNISAELSLLCYKDSTFIGSINSTGVVNLGILKIENVTVRENTNRILFAIRIIPNSIGATGTAWIKNAVLEKSNVSREYISTGTKSTVSAIRARSVGKNILGGEKFAQSVIKAAGSSTHAYKTTVDNRNVLALVGGSGVYLKTVFDKFKENTQYTIQFYAKKKEESTGGYFYLRYTDGTSGSIPLKSTSWEKTVVTSDAGKTIRDLRTTYSSAGKITYYDIDTFQIEEGDTTTEYEPYKESVAYITAKDESGNIFELRSLPNGVKDEVNLSQGKRTQRVSEDIVVSDTVYDSIDTSTYTNVDVVITTVFADAKAGTTGADGQTHYYNKDGVELAEVAQADIDLEASVGKYYWGEDKKLYIIVAKGDYADIAATRTGLDVTSLNYQLAMPVETPVQVSGTLVSYPSGTVYIEPYVADAGIYTDKMEVLYSDLPIKALEKISKVDFDTGLETELDITAAVIAEDKLSFTHPDLTSGDIVFFVYEHGAEGTLPETEISYYDSRYVIKGEDDKFYQWEIEAKLVEGVITPSIKLVEV